jgi:ribonuclease VapC
MVLDTSAVVAIALNEPERPAFLQQLVEAGKIFISAATLVEVAIVLETRVGQAATREMETFLLSLGAEVVSVDRIQAEQAQMAYRRYGKGRHPAALNFGDCFTYALAVVSGEVVLAKGQEFQKAGLRVA